MDYADRRLQKSQKEKDLRNCCYQQNLLKINKLKDQWHFLQ